MHVGQLIVLDPFQRAFIMDVYDNPAGTNRGILSIARKNGKTSLIAALLLAHIVGPEAIYNSQIVSGALSKEQAALIFNAAAKMIALEPELQPLAHIVPSKKRIVGLACKVDYQALAADGKTTQGLSPVLALLDETGQVKGPSSPFVDAIITSQGAHANPLLLVISTQAPSDADLLSLWIDDAIRSGDPHIICHVHAASEDCDLLDEAEWRKANPALGTFRSMDDLRRLLTEASRLPSREAGARNLLLNQRIAQERLWLAPSLWKACNGAPDLAVFRENPTALGVDLSARTDLTAAVLAAMDADGVVHIQPYCFTPLSGIRDRALAHKVPYDLWANQGQLIAVPGASINYDYVSQWMRTTLEELEIEPVVVAFDKWRMDVFKRAADDAGMCSYAEWRGVHQGYFSMSPRIEAFEAKLLAGKIRHGGHPCLNLGAASALATMDAAGNRKLDKSLSTQRIDALVAAVMAAFEVSEGGAQPVDIDAMIG